MESYEFCKYYLKNIKMYIYIWVVTTVQLRHLNHSYILWHTFINLHNRVWYGISLYKVKLSSHDVTVLYSRRLSVHFHHNSKVKCSKCELVLSSIAEPVLARNEILRSSTAQLLAWNGFAPERVQLYYWHWQINYYK